MVSLQLATLLLAASGAGETVLLDFSADWCGPCQAMRPVVQKLGAAGYPVREVNFDRNRALAAKHRVGPIPCFVLLVNGREVDRAVGVQRYDHLQQMMRRAGVGPPAAGGGVARGQSPDPPRASEPSFAKAAVPERIGRESGARLASASSPSRESLPAQAAGSRISESCVRIKVEDPDGHSYVSGTVIDVHGQEALVLTCGHVFRGTGGNGRILIDTFGPRPQKQLLGKLIIYDLKRDLALISLRSAFLPPAIRVAPSGSRIRRGDQVVSIGCDLGAEPTARESQVTAIDKYLGLPHVMVAGAPAKGRSGGGLINAGGQLVGVCNAADDRAREGLYAATSLIHEQLDHAKLTFIYEAKRDPGKHGLASNRSQEDRSRSARAPFDRNPPKMAGAMPRAVTPVSGEARLGQLTETSVSELRAPSRGVGRPAEAAAVADARDVEVVCIIRPRGGSGAKSKVVILDRASPELLDQLLRAGRIADSPRPVR